MLDKSEQANRNILQFSLRTAFVGWVNGLLVFPIDKMNIRMKVGSCKHRQLFRGIRELYKSQGIRGIYRGATATPFTTFVSFFLNAFLYEHLNYKWKHTESLRNSPLFSISPIINIYLAGIIPFFIGTPGTMLTVEIHSTRTGPIAAMKQLLKKINPRLVFNIFKINYSSIATFMCIRQFIYEHLTRFLQVRCGLSQKVSVITTTIVASFIASSFYQPLEVIMANMTYQGIKNPLKVIQILRESPEGLTSSLFAGYRTRITSSMIFAMLYMPWYSTFKHEFDLHTYF